MTCIPYLMPDLGFRILPLSKASFVGSMGEEKKKWAYSFNMKGLIFFTLHTKDTRDTTHVEIDASNRL